MELRMIPGLTQQKNMSLRFAVAAITLLPVALAGQTAPTSGVRPQRLIIRNAMIVDGNGTPAKGPFDITVVDGITRSRSASVAHDPVAKPHAGWTAAKPARGDATTKSRSTATGKIRPPGLINAHAHLQDERAGVPQPIEYELKIWLACGITTIRDVGSTTRKALAWRDSSAKGRLAAPRILPVYPQFGPAHERRSRLALACGRSRRRAPTGSGLSPASIAMSCRRWRM